MTDDALTSRFEPLEFRRQDVRQRAGGMQGPPERIPAAR
jgi:hypothetical protein